MGVSIFLLVVVVILLALGTILYLLLRGAAEAAPRGGEQAERGRRMQPDTDDEASS
jgi:hypothetical protein